MESINVGHAEAELEAPKGGFGPLSFLIALIITGIVAGLLGALYGFLNDLIPFIYVNVILMFGLGCGIGFIAVISSAMVRLKNGIAILAVAFFSSLIGVYIAWVVHIQRLFEDTVWMLGTLVNRANTIAETGYWEIAGFAPSGVVLWGLWVIEALFIMGSSFYAIINLLGDEH